MHIEDHEGKTALDYAIEKKQKNCVDVIRNVSDLENLFDSKALKFLFVNRSGKKILHGNEAKAAHFVNKTAFLQLTFMISLLHFRS